VLVQPKLAELDQIIVSHDSEGRLNAAYPHAEGVQPRDRGAAPSQDQVREIACGKPGERHHAGRLPRGAAPVLNETAH